jgi:hypothetical protein
MHLKIETQNVAQLDSALNLALLESRFEEAFETLYDENVIMQENASPPCAGKIANRKRQEYYGTVAECTGVRLLGSAVSGDQSYSEWEFDITFQGLSYKIAEVAVRKWREGKVVSERFYWNQAGR